MPEPMSEAELAEIEDNLSFGYYAEITDSQESSDVIYDLVAEVRRQRERIAELEGRG